MFSSTPCLAHTDGRFPSSKYAFAISSPSGLILVTISFFIFELYQILNLVSRTIFICIIMMRSVRLSIESRFFKKLYAWGCHCVTGRSGLLTPLPQKREGVNPSLLAISQISQSCRLSLLSYVC